MISHNLLVAVFTASCVALSAASNDSTITRTYPARVFNTTQGECPSDAQREIVIAEVKEDIRNLLPLFGKCLHLMCNYRLCLDGECSFTCPEKKCAPYCKTTKI